MWVKRFIFSPVRWEVAVIMSLILGVTGKVIGGLYGIEGRS